MATKMSSRTAYAILAAAMMAVLVLAAMVVFDVANRKQITRQNQVYLKDASAQQAANVDAAIKEGYDNVRILSNLVSEGLTSPVVDMARVRELMEDSIFDFVEFVDMEGWDHTVMNSKTWAGDRKYYLDGALKGGIGMETVFHSRATHETLFMFYAPVRYREDRIGAIIGVYQAAKRISGLLSIDYFGETASSYLVSEDGRILASNLRLDPDRDYDVSDLAGDDIELGHSLYSALKSKENSVFSMKSNVTGVCVTGLEEPGWSIIQVFPQKANDAMVRGAVSKGIYLVLFLLVIYAAILFLIVMYLRKNHEEELQLKKRYEDERHRKDAEYQEQLQDALDLAETANRSKTSFLFNMSHDIRTPMNAISGFTAMAKKNLDDPVRLKDCLDKITVAEENLLELINKVLDMSRIESGKIVLDSQPCDVIERVEAITTIVKASAEMKDVDLENVFTDIRDRKVVADVGRMNQVMLNILGNAIKYTPAGGKVTMSTEQMDCDRPGFGKYRFTVKDTGIGMTKDYLKTIYDPFSREMSATESKVEGTGLGMSIVKRLVDLMGGSIDIQTEKGVGTEISILLELPLQDNVEPAPEQAGENAVRPDLAGRRVLLVEDNALNREIARFILEEQKMTVEEVEDGELAVGRIKELFAKGDYGYYDFVLMDIQMPHMNGYDATMEIRAIDVPEGFHLPIIAMTANAFDEDRRDAVDAGMDAHLAKPIDVDALIDTLSGFIK